MLECSDELEVIEVGSPAEHTTCVEHDLELPNDHIDRERDFSGQRFARHQASGAVLQEWSVAGFDARDTGIAAASREAIGVRVVRPAADDAEGELSHGDNRRFWFILRGALTLSRGGETHRLEMDGACVLPTERDLPAVGLHVGTSSFSRSPTTAVRSRSIRRHALNVDVAPEDHGRDPRRRSGFRPRTVHFDRARDPAGDSGRHGGRDAGAEQECLLGQPAEGESAAYFLARPRASSSACTSMSHSTISPSRIVRVMRISGLPASATTTV